MKRAPESGMSQATGSPWFQQIAAKSLFLAATPLARSMVWQ
jgi:hypothetical protein